MRSPDFIDGMRNAVTLQAMLTARIVDTSALHIYQSTGDISYLPEEVQELAEAVEEEIAEL